MSSKTLVSAAVVRAWGRANVDLIPEGARKGLGETARGRVHPDIRSAFEKANKGKAYVTASDAEKPTVTVPVTALDKAGRKMTRKVTLTTAEARVALGHEKGKRGRFSLDTLSLALSASEADAVADQFSTAV